MTEQVVRKTVFLTDIDEYSQFLPNCNGYLAYARISGFDSAIPKAFLMNRRNEGAWMCASYLIHIIRKNGVIIEVQLYDKVKGKAIERVPEAYDDLSIFDAIFESLVGKMPKPKPLAPMAIILPKAHIYPSIENNLYMSALKMSLGILNWDCIEKKESNYLVYHGNNGPIKVSLYCCKISNDSTTIY